MTHKLIGGQIGSFPGLPRFFTFFGIYIIHGSGRVVKTGKGLGAFIRSMTSGGCKLDTRGGGGGNCQNDTLDHPFECSTTVLDSRP